MTPDEGHEHCYLFNSIMNSSRHRLFYPHFTSKQTVALESCYQPSKVAQRIKVVTTELDSQGLIW